MNERSQWLNVGSGPGWSDFNLAARGYDVTGIDNEPSLVELATMRTERLNVSARFEVADAFDLSSFCGRFESKFGYGDLASNRDNLLLRRAMLRAVWRWLQNRGNAYCIAVVGAK